MPAPVATFVVELRRDESVDLVRNGRKPFAYDLDDLDEALDRIRRHEGKGVTVLVVEGDGTRRRVRT